MAALVGRKCATEIGEKSKDKIGRGGDDRA